MKQLYEFNNDTYKNLNQYTNITYLGIQAQPGTQIQINGTASLVVGSTGILQLDIGLLNPPLINVAIIDYSINSNIPLLIHIIGEKRG